MHAAATSIWTPRLTGGALIVVLLLTGILRYGLIDVPLERDEGEYAYAGQLLLEGVPPYRDVFNMKMPGTYAAYAAGMAVFGQSHRGIHTALLVVNLLTVILVFLLAAQVINRLGAITAAASFAVLSLGQAVLGVSANAEHFVILFATGGLVVLLRSLSAERPFMLFLSGVLLGLGFLMKQHGAVFILLAALYAAYDSLHRHPVSRAALTRNITLLFGGVLSVVGGLILLLAWANVFRTFRFWTFDYAAAYISQVPPDLIWQRLRRAVTALVAAAPLLWLLAAAGFPAMMTRSRLPAQRVFLVLFSICAILAIFPGFYFRRHYFILLLPCASLLAGAAISGLADCLAHAFNRPVRYGLPLFILVFCLGHTLYSERAFLFRMTPFQISRTTYWLNPFPESLEIARFIRRHTRPEDRIAILGSEPQIFFYAQRRSASGYIYMYPLMEIHDFARQMQRDFIQAVESANPRFVVYVNVPTSWLQRPDSHQDLFHWFDRALSEGRLQLAGLTALYEDRAAYYWQSDVVWPAPSQYWVAVFERPG